MAWEPTNRSENCIHARVTFGEGICPWELLENFVQGTAGQMHLCGFIFQIAQLFLLCWICLNDSWALSWDFHSFPFSEMDFFFPRMSSLTKVSFPKPACQWVAYSSVVNWLFNKMNKTALKLDAVEQGFITYQGDLAYGIIVPLVSLGVERENIDVSENSLSRRQKFQ